MTTLVTISRYDELKDDHLTSYPSNIELSFLERDESIMYTTVSDFITEWKREAELTQKVLDSLTDEFYNSKYILKAGHWGELLGIS